MKSIMRPCALLLCGFLCLQAQEAGPKFQLKVINDASQFRKAKKGRVSSEVAVEVRDSNDKPVSGIIVAFTIPQTAGGGAAFANGTMLTTLTTNAQGIASATFSTGAANFSVGVTATVPGSASLTASVPVSVTSAMVGAGAGLSTAAILTIVGVGAAAAVGAGMAMGGGDKGSSPSTPITPPVTPPGIRITGGAPVFGPPR